MSINKKWFILLLLLLIDLPKVTAYPSGNTTPPTFTFDQGFGYDSWGITRNSADGFRGYIPFLALETLGENKEFAYAIGERFRNSYSNDIALADAILAYVQRWTEYGYDEDNVYMNRVAQEEWAWNADEMAHVFNENKGITAIGDCEDVAFLCLTIYYAAGIETSIVDAPGHCALLIWMPNYPNANIYWELSDDPRGPGWIWVEATGDDNSVGWTPSDFHDGHWDAWTVKNETFKKQHPTEDYSEDNSWGLLIDIIILILTIMAKIFLKF